MSTDLNFKKPYTPPAGGSVGLNFATSQDITRITGTVSLHQNKPTLHIQGTAGHATPRTGTLTMQVRKPSLQLIASYDNRVWRGAHAEKGQVYESATPASPAKSSAFHQSTTLNPAKGAAWLPCQPLSGDKSGAYKQASRLRAVPSAVYESSAPLPVSRHHGWGDTRKVKVVGRMVYKAAALPLTSERAGRWQYPPHVKVAKTQRYAEAKPQGGGFRFPAKAGSVRNKTTKLLWEEAVRPRYGHEAPIITPPGPPSYVGTTALNFICPWLDYAGNDILLNLGRYPCKEVEPQLPADTVIVPVKKVYIVINNVLLRRVDGNVELPTFSLSLSIDADSWTWGFNAALPAAAQDVIEPGSDGTPVELEAVINGTAYRVLAENISRDRSFGQAVIRVSGKGKSAMLGAPYAPILNFGNAQARTAQQLMNDALTINGASIGRTVNWGLTDWLVPTGAWAHQGTYITALNTIAEAAGGYIQPHPTQKQLNVLARYPTAPWNWGSLTPDFELPSDVTTREGIEWVERPRYNRIFVTGEGQGVLGQVTRAGTAGDILAPLVTDALITHSDAARQRGLSVLADTGRQAHLSLRLPVLAETGVIQPGKFVRYVDGGTTRIGIVRSTAIEVGMPEVWQTIGVETHVA